PRLSTWTRSTGALPGWGRATTMFILRRTRKLLDRVEQISLALVPSTTILGDWFAQPLSIGRRRFILLASERTRLPMLMPAREVRRLGQTFPTALAEMLLRLEIDPETIGREIAAMQEYAVAATNNRSVLGSLNDYARLAHHLFARDPDADPLEVALWLSDVPAGPLGYKAPRDAARRLLGGGSTLNVLGPPHSTPGFQPLPAAPPAPSVPAPATNRPAAKSRTYITDLRTSSTATHSPPIFLAPHLRWRCSWVESWRG
ncbi:MAG: hypothetical protein M1337_07180, partial [Actinobacteria bacterium]|nr:hypothetical protein [Actinomycetota bacterium]